MAPVMMLVTLKTMDQSFYRRYFHNVSLWEKVYLGCSASCDDIITGFVYYENLLQRPAL